MKKILLITLMILLFSGCGFFGDRTYVSVKPHDEGFEVAIDSNAITVNSYLGLKNAIMGFVQEGVENGVIYAESYPGEIRDDLDDAVYEVWRGDPLGSFAVDYMTYDCSKIVNRYEIHIHVTFRRSIEEIESIVFSSDHDETKHHIRNAMEEYAPTLILRVGDYDNEDLQAMAEEVYFENPEFAMEIPVVTYTSYPESGAQRILEIKFDYQSSRESLFEKKMELTELVSLLVDLYGSNHDPAISAKRFYDRVSRDGIFEPVGETFSAFSSSAYGALILESANSTGYANTYKLLMNSKDIPCVTVQGKYLGQNHTFCWVSIDNEVFYVDPSKPIFDPATEIFLMSEEDLWSNGYELK